MSVIDEYQQQASLASINKKSRCCFTFLYNESNKPPRKWFGGDKMRKILASVALCVLFAGMVPLNVVGDDSFDITGTLTCDDTGDPLANIEISFTNLRTQEIEYATTNSTGVYQFNLSEFNDNWMDGDYIAIHPAPAVQRHGYICSVILNALEQHIHCDLTESLLAGELAMFIGVSNRQSNTNNIMTNIDDDQHIDFYVSHAQDLHVYTSCSYYDDALTNLPDHSATYNVSIYYYIKVTVNGWAYYPENSLQMYYDTVYNGNEVQRDPLIEVSLDYNNYNLQPFNIWGSIHLIVKNMNTQPEVENWYQQVIITGVKYDWN
jgi:hypothetical protein